MLPECSGPSRGPTKSPELSASSTGPMMARKVLRMETVLWLPTPNQSGLPAVAPSPITALPAPEVPTSIMNSWIMRKRWREQKTRDQGSILGTTRVCFSSELPCPYTTQQCSHLATCTFKRFLSFEKSYFQTSKKPASNAFPALPPKNKNNIFIESLMCKYKKPFVIK